MYPWSKATNLNPSPPILAPEARPKVAHGETVGKKLERHQPRLGRKNETPLEQFSVAPAGALDFYPSNPRLRRELLSAATPWLNFNP
jgi:hypothetical protein